MLGDVGVYTYICIYIYKYVCKIQAQEFGVTHG